MSEQRTFCFSVPHDGARAHVTATGETAFEARARIAPVWNVEPTEIRLAEREAKCSWCCSDAPPPR